ncbi:MAG: ABC transporter permease [Natrialbaceae archaeon]|nr:ABC transporter permease [Natrialbaceae archaeon]
MDILVLLKKEFSAIRGNLGMFLVLLVILPGMFVGVTSVYEQTIPEHVSLGVVPADDSVTDADVNLVRPVIGEFGSVTVFEEKEEARRALQREQVYVIVEVPNGYRQGSAGNDTNITLLMDGSFTLLEEPMSALAGGIETVLHADAGGIIVNETSVTTETIGDTRSLPEFLIPAVMLAFVVLYGMVYVPYQVRGERLVMDRLQTETRLDYVVLSKLIFYGVMLTVPAAVVVGITMYLGYNIAALSPFTLAVLFLTFIYLAAFSLSILFFTQLEKTGLFLNVGLAIVSLALSALIFPVGFFSEIEQVIASILPTWYSVATFRSAMLRDASMTLYVDYFAIIIGSGLAGLVLLKLSLIYYKRRR